MRVDRLVLGALDTNAWIVDDATGGPAVVIDPGDDSQVVLEALSGRELGVIVLTHGHFDHIGAVRELVEATGAPIAIHEADADRITTAEASGGSIFGFHAHHAPEPDVLLCDGETIDAGELEMSVLHTPGHTPGSICLLCGGHLFSGDTLFAGSVGRTDFPGGDARALRDSIVRVLAPLPDDTVVHPGHGPDSTIGRERRINPFFPRA